jgi:hypothetical protein
MRLLVAGLSLAGASVSLWGCGGADDTTGAPTPAPAGPTPAPPPYNWSSVQEVWDNHFGAFAEFNVPRIMKDYDANSQIATFNDACFFNETERNGYTVYKGVSQIQGFFQKLFAQLDNKLANVNNIGPSGAVAAGTGGPVVKEAAEEKIYNGNVFLTWRTVDTLANPIDLATDSFSFKIEDGKYLIDYQTIVTTETKAACPANPGQNPKEGSEPIFAAWKNHFTAFGAKNLDDIMKEYDSNSIVQLYDNRVQKYEVFETEAAIRGMFDALFKAITAGAVNSDEGVEVGLLEIEPELNSVFLMWKSNSHPQATDTFIFNGNKIARQNIVVTTKAPPTQGMLV